MRFSEKLSRLRPMGPDGRSARPDTLPEAQAASNGAAPGPGTPPAALDPHPADGDGRSERLARLRALMGDVVARDRRRVERGWSAGPTGEPALLPVGELVDQGHGPMYLLERYLEPHHCHGRVPVASALQVPADLISALSLDPMFYQVDPAGMLILDTETTGLSGGTGTVPFLIGMAYFDDGVLKVEQLFLRNLGGEVPLLRQLEERIAAASCVVSYNGKSFDWPLLRSRYILNRVPAPALPPHLDLLHCARRVFKPRLEAVTLTAVEREVLGFYREDDIHGAEIPGLYMSYLRGGDPRGVLPILSHNELDLIALASLLGELGKHFGDVQQGADARDLLAYARVAARAAGQPVTQASDAADAERALRFARAAVDAAEDDELRLRASALVADLLRRRGDYRGAAGCLQAALGECPAAGERAQVHLALAKLYEHRLRDFPLAERHARHTQAAEGIEAHGRRLGRLRRRLLSAP